jgi:hypothetical protein
LFGLDAAEVKGSGRLPFLLFLVEMNQTRGSAAGKTRPQARSLNRTYEAPLAHDIVAFDVIIGISFYPSYQDPAVIGLLLSSSYHFYFPCHD